MRLHGQTPAGWLARTTPAVALASKPVLNEHPILGHAQRWINLCDVVQGATKAHGASDDLRRKCGVVAQIRDRITLLFDGRVIEAASSADVLEAPKHPYTRALLEACPRYDRPDAGLTPIPERVVAELRAELPEEPAAR